MSTESTEVDYALTADDIAALREADVITFHHGPENTQYVSTSIRAHLDRLGYATDEPIWTVREQRLFNNTVSHNHQRARTIAPAASTVHSYKGRGTESSVAYHYMSNNATWQTITDLLRKGDTLFLEWKADNNSRVIESADFHRDQLFLRITRKTGAQLVFLIETSVGLDNSARMIKPNG